MLSRKQQTDTVRDPLGNIVEHLATNEPDICLQGLLETKKRATLLETLFEHKFDIAA